MPPRNPPKLFRGQIALGQIFFSHGCVDCLQGHTWFWKNTDIAVEVFCKSVWYLPKLRMLLPLQSFQRAVLHFYHFSPVSTVSPCFLALVGQGFGTGFWQPRVQRLARRLHCVHLRTGWLFTIDGKQLGNGNLAKHRTFSMRLGDRTNR